jgi:hypothetical protein
MDFIHRLFGSGAHTIPHPDPRRRLEVLKARYQPMFRLMDRQGVTFEEPYVEGERLVVRGEAPTAEARKAVLSLIDTLDANRSDLSVEITVRADLVERDY